jgi:hypothetical protein
MAKFIGSSQEFHHFIGPKLRNAINNITRKHRSKRNGICDECGKQAELHSAHLHGRDRRTIIEAILRDYSDNKHTISCDLEEIEGLILQAHLPIEGTFRFLCPACHAQYDRRVSSSKPEHHSSKRTSRNDDDFQNLRRIKLWANHPGQINHQIVRAFLTLARNGQVEYSDLKQYCTGKLNISRFDGHFASMKTDAGHAHGKIFFMAGSKVKLWDRARKEIEIHFGV